MSSSAREPPPGSTAWHNPGGPGRSGRSKPPPCQGPVARKEGQTPLRVCPPDEISRRRGPSKTAFWFLCRRGQRNPPPGRRNSPFAWVCLSERSERHERIAGGRRNRTGGQPPGPPCRLTPGPHYGGRLPGDGSAHPARAGQGIAFRSAPLPLAGQRGAGRPAGRRKRAWCQQP